MVDQGGPAVLTLWCFREYIAKPAASRVLAVISACMLSGLEGHIDQDGKLNPVMRKAPTQRLKTDVGHGSHFSFKMAQLMLDAGIIPDTLEAGMRGDNTTIPKPCGTPETHPDTEEMHMFAGNHYLCWRW